MNVLNKKSPGGASIIRYYSTVLHDIYHCTDYNESFILAMCFLRYIFSSRSCSIIVILIIITLINRNSQGVLYIKYIFI